MVPRLIVLSKKVQEQRGLRARRHRADAGLDHSHTETWGLSQVPSQIENFQEIIKSHLFYSAADSTYEMHHLGEMMILSSVAGPRFNHHREIHQHITWE